MANGETKLVKHVKRGDLISGKGNLNNLFKNKLKNK